MFDAGIIKDEIYKGHRIIVKRIVGGRTFHGIPSHWYCGYVEIKKGSMFYGKAYRDIDREFDVHGGLTFSGELEDVEGYFWDLTVHILETVLLIKMQITLLKCVRSW